MSLSPPETMIDVHAPPSDGVEHTYQFWFDDVASPSVTFTMRDCQVIEHRYNKLVFSLQITNLEWVYRYRDGGICGFKFTTWGPIKLKDFLKIHLALSHGFGAFVFTRPYPVEMPLYWL